VPNLSFMMMMMIPQSSPEVMEFAGGGLVLSSGRRSATVTGADVHRQGSEFGEGWFGSLSGEDRSHYIRYRC